MRAFTTLKTKLLCLLLSVSLIASSVTACGTGNDSKLPTDDKNTSESSSAVSDSTQSESSATSESLQPSESSAEVSEEALAEQERFSAYTRELFLESALDNTINLHYTLADPEGFGITEYPITLGSFEEWTEEDILTDLDEMSVELKTYDYSLLTDEQKMTYDILIHYIDTERLGASMSLYYEPLGPTTGAATQLPITFAEYKFYREQDVIDYLRLLPMLKDYFDSIMALQRRRADAGLFMTEATLDANLEICANFVANPENNFLITSFTSRMEKIDWLDDQKKADYIAQNTAIVHDSIIPAFNALSDALEAMRGSCTEDGGLARLPQGKEYFTYLMESRIGSDRDVSEMVELLESYQMNQLTRLQALFSANPALAQQFDSFEYTYTDPEAALNYLKNCISEDYPEIPETSFTINYVEKELEEVMSPAFYMIPPLDRYLENTIYINNGSVDDDTIFTTLAHEGYPGHLYQNVYFNSNNSEPLRSMLSYLGYSEGWSTYVENESYAYDPKITDALAEAYALNSSVILSVYALLDICINYLGWDRAQTGDYVEQFFGEQPAEVINEIYDAIAGDPCYYLAYHGGYIEILELRSIAETTLGDNFNLKEFHKFFLDLGECPFSLANQRLADWLEDQK